MRIKQKLCMKENSMHNTILQLCTVQLMGGKQSLKLPVKLIHDGSYLSSCDLKYFLGIFHF